MQKISNKTLIKIIAAVAIVAIIVGIYYIDILFTYESTDDAFIAGHITAISSWVDGHVIKVYVNDNQSVKKGDLLVALDPCDFQAKLDLETASLAAAMASVEQSRAKIDAAQAEAKRAEKDFKRYEMLLASNGGVTQQQVDNAAAASQLAAAELDSAEKQMKVAQAHTAQEKAAIEQAELNLSYTKINAPQSGRLVKKSVEDGEYIRVGQTLMFLVPPEVWVIANFKETQLKYMKPRQPVQIRIDAFPQKTFKGHVDSIQRGTGSVFTMLPPENATGNYVKVVQRVPVKIVFDADPNETIMLSPGMSVVPRVKVR
jgi:membrane fusion protein (multidrug efflux system)